MPAPASPEELRALVAAKLEEKRSYEKSLWRHDVRPALMRSGKRRFRMVDLRGEEVNDRRGGLGTGDPGDGGRGRAAAHHDPDELRLAPDPGGGRARVRLDAGPPARAPAEARRPPPLRTPPTDRRYPRPVPRGRTAKVLTHHFDGTGLRRRPDQLIVEEPLEIHLDDHLVATTMRTPGHDFELAAGFCSPRAAGRRAGR